MLYLIHYKDDISSINQEPLFSIPATHRFFTQRVTLHTAKTKSADTFADTSTLVAKGLGQ
jgi:hypothetical protein